MMGLTSRTGTRRNITALRSAGWGWIVGPLDHGTEDMFGMPYALDNGEWPAHANGTPWDEGAFLRALDRFGAGAMFIVVPDVVADREASLARTKHWLPILQAREDLARVPLLIAVQDGMTFEDIEPFLTDPRIGIFLGGSTEWKERNIIPWGRFCEERGLYYHVGRVNTARRIHLCAAAKAKSFDGSGVGKFIVTLPALDGARRQHDLGLCLDSALNSAA